MRQWRVGIDVGGTFTDLVAYSAEGEELFVDKVSSTPKDPAIAVLTALQRLQKYLKGDEIELLSHGTTVGVNALIQGKGPKVGLLITDGFRDLPYIQARREQKHRIDFFSTERRRLIPSREFVQAIPERVDRSGQVLVPLDEEAVRRAARAFKELGVESVAVCYIFSFANPAHERRSKEILREELSGVPITLSTEVMPRIREWPRFSTTILDAIAAPVLQGYIRRLEESFAQIGLPKTPRFLMQANGGILPFQGLLTGGNAVYTLMSGPVAAVMGGQSLGHASGFGNLVIIDIGGTSCDIAFVTDGQVNLISEWDIAGYDTYFPAVDVSSIGAGGGTIVWVDEAGYPHFGPQSGGADPGPACYGKGSTSPTVTDADLVLGFLNPDYFLGGEIKLKPELARKAVEEGLAQHLKTDVIQAAKGIVRMANDRMADEISVLVAQRGIDMRDAVLVAGGGAGPVHGPFLAEELGIRKVLVPLAPGAFSAMGLLCVDVAHDYIKSDLGLLHELTPARLNQAFREMEADALAEVAREGLPTNDVKFSRELDVRYAGQGFELRVEVKKAKVDEEEKAEVARKFEALHEQLYGHAMPGEALEVVSYRLRAVVGIPKYDWARARGATDGRGTPAPESRRMVHFPALDKAVECPVYRKEKLSLGFRAVGPLIVEQRDTTVVVPPGWSLQVDRLGLLLERKA